MHIRGKGRGIKGGGSTVVENERSSKRVSMQNNSNWKSSDQGKIHLLRSTKLNKT